MSPEAYSEPRETTAVEFLLEKFMDFSCWLFWKDLHPRFLVDFWLHLLSQSWCPFIICIITYFSYLDPR